MNIAVWRSQSLVQNSYWDPHGPLFFFFWKGKRMFFQKRLYNIQRNWGTLHSLALPEKRSNQVRANPKQPTSWASSKKPTAGPTKKQATSQPSLKKDDTEHNTHTDHANAKTNIKITTCHTSKLSSLKHYLSATKWSHWVLTCQQIHK